MALHQKFFFALLALLPTQLGVHFWPEWAHVLGRRVDYLSPTLYLTDVLVFFILATWKFSKIHYKKILPFLFFVGLNIFFAVSKSIAIYKWLKVLEFVALGWYVLKTRPNVSRVAYYLSVGVVYSSILAISQFVLQRSLGLWIFGERTFAFDTPGIARMSWGRQFLRPYATFPHPNVLGGFLAAMVPLLIFKRSVGVLAIIALFLTFSRSAWLALVIGIAIAKKKVFLPILLLFFIFTFTFNAHEESVTLRQELNSAAIATWQTSPLLGVGLGNFLVELPKHLVSREVYFLQPVHNIYLLILAETGIVGLGIFIWVIFCSLKKFKPALFILLLLGLVDHYPITLQQGQLLLAILLVLQ